jgi:hypothetical protein
MSVDWDDPRIRAIGRRYAAEAFDLADELKEPTPLSY